MEEFFNEEGLNTGRIISYSKSAYRESHPDNKILFNANIFVLGEGKIWYGDLDLTLDEKVLERIASKISKDLFILSEMDGRFGNENLSDPEIIKRSYHKISK
jgi:hypothetical protein